MKAVCLLFVLLIGFAVTSEAQSTDRIGRIAILSFNGGSPGERDGIPELFSITKPMMRNFMVIPRTTITKAIDKETEFQMSSGMTDSDTIARLGNQFGADYVMSGSITSLGSSNLLIVSIVKIGVIQQVAGAYLEYDTLDDLNKDSSLIDKMAQDLVAMVRNDSGYDDLALLPVEFGDGANRQEGDALAQLLSIFLIQNGKYAVYPRTRTLEQVQQEYNTQLSGQTRDSEAVALGRGINPPLVLAIVSRKIGTQNRFNASVISVEGGHQVDGSSELYTSMADGMSAMELIAKQLSGVEVTEKERTKRADSVANTEAAERKAAAEAKKKADAAEAKKKADAAAAAAAAKREAAANAFLRRSGITLSGWVNFSPYKIETESTTTTTSEGSSTSSTGDTKSLWSGGVGVEFDLGLFGIQSGLGAVQKVQRYRTAAVTALQVPLLARLDLDFGIYGISPYGGIGFNVVSFEKGAYSGTSAIVGVDLTMRMGSITWLYMLQYNHDPADSDYMNRTLSFGLGVSGFIPFRKK